MTSMNPRVKEVTPQDDYHLRVTFTNGEIGIYDCRPLLDFGVFRGTSATCKRIFRRVRDRKTDTVSSGLIEAGSFALIPFISIPSKI